MMADKSCNHNVKNTFQRWLLMWWCYLCHSFTYQLVSLSLALFVNLEKQVIQVGSLVCDNKNKVSEAKTKTWVIYEHFCLCVLQFSFCILRVGMFLQNYVVVVFQCNNITILFKYIYLFFLISEWDQRDLVFPSSLPSTFLHPVTMATIPAVSMTTTLTSLLLTALSLSSLLHNGRWNKAVGSGHCCPFFPIITGYNQSVTGCGSQRRQCICYSTKSQTTVNSMILILKLNLTSLRNIYIEIGLCWAPHTF